MNYHPRDWEFKPTEVIEYCNMEIENNSNNENSFCNRGIANSMLEKYEEAIKDFEEAIKM